MIITSALQNMQQPETPPREAAPDPAGSIQAGRVMTRAHQAVSPELAKRVASYFRCLNTIADDIANMPLQLFRRTANGTQRILPDAAAQNIAYLLEIRPNRWTKSPAVLKRTAAVWLLSWGNALIWQPAPPAPRELFVLPTNFTRPLFDPNANLWYEVRLPGRPKPLYIPEVEVMHLMINSTNGIWGRSILEYARETIGQRIGMSETQSSILGNGLNPSAYIQVSASLDGEAREKYRKAYADLMAGADKAGTLAVFDNKVVKFEPITMKLTDAQFLETVDATDGDICNFFKFPEHKLNMGKQSYESNAQQDLEYLKGCLDPYLVQWEQAARVAWLPDADQGPCYFKFVREAMLRTDAKTRAELHEIRIRSGTLTPNEAREHEDQDAYLEGDRFYMTSNNAPVDAVPSPGGSDAP